MSNKSREFNAFLLRKAPIMREHVVQENALRDQTASRNFRMLPGQFFNGITALEIATKLRLDEANLQVLQECIEAELRLKGMENNKAAHDARLAFQISKTDLLNALNLELADMRRQTALEEYEARLIAIEVAAREIVIMLAEAGIQEEIELLRQQELDEEARPLAKEVELAEAKLDLAQERLKIIPFIRTVIAEQKKVIDYERDEITPLMDQKILRQEDLIDVRRDELIPAMQALSVKIKEWAIARPDVIDALKEKAQAMTNLAYGEQGLTVFLVAMAQAKKGFAESLSGLLPYRVDVANAEVNKASNLVDKAAADLLVARAEQRLAEEQSKRIGPLSEKSGALTSLADKQRTEVVPALQKDAYWRLESAQARAAAAAARELSMVAEIQFLMANVSAEEAQLAVELTRAHLDIIRREGALSEAEAEAAGMTRLMSVKEGLTGERIALLSKLAAAKESRLIENIRERTLAQIDANDNKIEGEHEYYSRTGATAREASIEIARINAHSKVSSRLIHNIG